jgi:hypothetical protein
MAFAYSSMLLPHLQQCALRFTCLEYQGEVREVSTFLTVDRVFSATLHEIVVGVRIVSVVTNLERRTTDEERKYPERITKPRRSAVAV